MMDAKSSIKVACPACQTTKVSFLWLLVAMLFIFSPIAKGDCVVIDVLGGRDAEKYPVTRLDRLPEGGWSEEHKTSKIVFAKMTPSVRSGRCGSIGWDCCGVCLVLNGCRK